MEDNFKALILSLLEIITTHYHLPIYLSSNCFQAFYILYSQT